MSDLISRQVTIDALGVWCYDQSDERTIDEVLLSLPSAQPDFYDYSDIEPLWESFAKEHDVNLTDGAKQLKDAMWIGYRKGKADAQPEQRWIPCSESLPEDIEDTHPVVIICGDFGVSVGFYGEYVDGNRYWYDMGNGIERSTVKAYMPLPEPWKGDVLYDNGYER